jgi:hypothetical protein
MRPTFSSRSCSPEIQGEDYIDTKLVTGNSLYRPVLCHSPLVLYSTFLSQTPSDGERLLHPHKITHILTQFHVLES